MVPETQTAALGVMYGVNPRYDSSTGLFSKKVFVAASRLRTQTNDTLNIAIMTPDGDPQSTLTVELTKDDQTGEFIFPLESKCEPLNSVTDFVNEHVSLGIDYFAVGVLDDQRSEGARALHNSLVHSPTACWDIDGDEFCDATPDADTGNLEDLNGDGQCDALDCRGADGSSGPVGAAGPPGPAGPPGSPPEISIQNESCERVTSEANSRKVRTTVSCSEGQRLVTGGGRCLTRRGELRASFPLGALSWAVECRRGKAEAYAVCCS